MLHLICKIIKNFNSYRDENLMASQLLHEKNLIFMVL